MKTFRIMVLTTLSILLSYYGFSQSKEQMIGKWKVISTNKDIMILQKIKESPSDFPDWGTFFQFHGNGTYTESASAPCGLDDNRYSYQGRWVLNSTNKTINLTGIKAISKRPNIYSNYELLSFGKLEWISHENDTLKLKVITPWEKITSK